MGRSTRLWLDATLLGGAVYLVAFAFVALSRARFGFDIEWMEGGMLTHAARLQAGQPIYAAPSADFVPFFYTPGYPAVLAALAPLFGGLSFGLARGVSILSTGVALWLIFRIGQREAGWRYGALAVGIYAALFRTNGAFYDLARPDALFMAILIGAVYVAWTRPSVVGAALAGLLFAAGFFTKQTVSVFVPATTLALFLYRGWRPAAALATTALAISAAGIWALDRAHDGWFWTYIFKGHQGHLFYWKNILMEYWRDVLFLAPALLLVPLLWFGHRVPVRILSILLAAHWTYAFIFRARTLDYVPHMYYRELWYEAPRWQILVPPVLIAALLLLYRWRNPVGRLAVRTHPFWLLMFLAGAGASGLNHSTQWAYSNCFMLLSAFGAILIALACRDLLEGEGDRRPRWAALVPAALLVQLVAWGYRPAAQIPDAGDVAALDRLKTRLAAVEGRVFIPAHPFLAWQRDGQTHVHQMGIQDVAFMKGGVADLPRRLRAGDFGAVVVDAHNRVPGLEGAYYLAERFRWPDEQALRARTGFLTRPEQLWLRQDPRPRDLGLGVSANFEEDGWRGWSASGDGFGAGPGRGAHRGQQGQRLARSTGPGRGRLRSAPVVATHRGLSLLIGGQGGAAGVRVLAAGAERARWPHRSRGDGLARVRLDLPAELVGQPVEIELFDDDPKGALWVDDLRWED